MGTLNIRCRIIIGIQKGVIILPTTHIRSLITYKLRSLRACHASLAFEIYELQPIFPHLITGHGFLIRDDIRDYRNLQDEPLCPLLTVPW